MAKMIFVNLPVADVARATAFYEALGFEKNPQFSGGGMSRRRGRRMAPGLIGFATCLATSLLLLARAAATAAAPFA